VTKGLHRADLAVSSNCDLARWEQSLVNFALGALEEFVNLGRVEADFARVLCDLMGCGHLIIS
jgi:hypothetical protein